MRVSRKLAVALRMPRSPIGCVPASPSTSELSTGVPDMTVDSARNSVPSSRASSASSTPCRATGHLFEVTTGIPRRSALRMWLTPGSPPSSAELAVTSTSTSASVASRPSRLLGQ
jgi:hypothetical protein